MHWCTDELNALLPFVHRLPLWFNLLLWRVKCLWLRFRS